MTSSQSRALAYAQLVRLPNLFTAVADPLAGWLVVGGGSPAWHLFPITGASACLYAAGMMFNDYFDLPDDRRERPQRPLPRGIIPARHAAAIASLLMIAGLGLAALAGDYAFGIALFLAAMILFYNSLAKQVALLGPLVLGSCRFANFLIGMRFAPPSLWWMPATLALYVVIVSFIARAETGRPAIQAVVKQGLLGIILLDALLVLSQGDLVGALLVAGLLIPASLLGRLFPMT